MNTTIFNAIVSILKDLSSLKGSDGTVRVYEYPTSKPDGYPSVYVVYEGEVAEVLDNQRDKVTYIYFIRVMQEQFEETGFTHAKAEKIARDRTYEICGAFRSNADLGVSGVLRTTPIKVDKGYIDNNTRIVLDITLEVETVEDVTC